MTFQEQRKSALRCAVVLVIAFVAMQVIAFWSPRWGLLFGLAYLLCCARFIWVITRRPRSSAALGNPKNRLRAGPVS